MECVTKKFVKTEFASLYKNASKTAEASLQNRIETYLLELKQKRQNNADKNRDFPKSFFGDSMKEESPSEDMEVDVKVLSNFRRKRLKFDLMKSEWFTEVPEDLEENWLVKYCPDGFRVVVVAKYNNTSVYARNGKCLFYFKSHLPGGGREPSNNVTVLDCVYNKNLKLIFIFDCMCWNNMSMLDSDASFRFYWLRNQFFENPNLTDTNRRMKLILMDHHPPSIASIQDHMFDTLQIGSYQIPYDGLLLYHKEGHYVGDVTPLCGWIASFSMSEVLKIDVSEKNLKKKPAKYESLKEYLVELSLKDKGTKSRDASMEDECAE